MSSFQLFCSHFFLHRSNVFFNFPRLLTLRIVSGAQQNQRLQRFPVAESMTGMPTKRSEKAGHFRVACSRLGSWRCRTTTRETSFLALVVPRFSPRSPFFRSSPTIETLEQANFSSKNCLLMDVPLYCGVTS